MRKSYQTVRIEVWKAKVKYWEDTNMEQLQRGDIFRILSDDDVQVKDASGAATFKCVKDPVIEYEPCENPDFITGSNAPKGLYVPLAGYKNKPQPKPRKTRVSKKTTKRAAKKKPVKRKRKVRPVASWRNSEIW